MKKLLLAPVLVLAALAVPGYAAAGPCGTPDSKPLWVDFATPEIGTTFGRPGNVLAVSSGAFPAQMRSAGAKTIYWDMYLRTRVGTPAAPADPALMEERAQRLFEIAVRQTACPNPPIVLNELFGSQLETPWSPANEQYRANVLAFLRGLAARGARPMLLLSRSPYTGSDTAVNWWRQVAQVSDLLPEVYFGGQLLWREGPILANRRLRTSMRNAVGRFTSIGVPTSRIGLTLGFFSKGNSGGREGLSDEKWLRIVKWQARAARQVAAETKVSYVVSWGWAPYSNRTRDLPDVAKTACVYLWSRDPAARACDGPRAAGPRFNADIREGQLDLLPSGARCTVNGKAVLAGAISALTRVTGDPAVAFTIAYARAAEAVSPVSAAKVAAAEKRIIRLRFGGNRSRYLAALRSSGASVKVARAALADELRRQGIVETMRGRVPGSEVEAFYLSYPDLPVRLVRAQPAPWWLGNRPQGLALSGIVPQAVFSLAEGRASTVLGLDGTYTVTALGEVQELGAVPFDQARNAIVAALSIYAKREAFEGWTLARQRGLLPQTMCQLDVMPQPSTIRVTDFMPFLSLDA
jgi:hypothetical protein